MSDDILSLFNPISNLSAHITFDNETHIIFANKTHLAFANETHITFALGTRIIIDDVTCPSSTPHFNHFYSLLPNLINAIGKSELQLWRLLFLVFFSWFVCFFVKRYVIQMTTGAQTYFYTTTILTSISIHWICLDDNMKLTPISSILAIRSNWSSYFLAMTLMQTHSISSIILLFTAKGV